LLDERYVTQVKALDAAFLAQQLAMQTALTAADKAVNAALEAAKEAVGKAETAANARFDSHNEFRKQLELQATTFMPRIEAELALGRTTDAINQLTTLVSGLVSRAEVDAIMLRNNERLLEIAERVTRAEGHGSGMGSAWVYLIGAVAAISTVVSIYSATRGH
jgi:hypothetical protein